MKKTYEKNLTVDFTVPFLSIKELEVTSELGGHVAMELKAVVEKGKYQQYIETIDSDTTICIEYLGWGGQICLFQGYIGNVGIDLQGGVPLLILSCLSFTGKMDTTSKKRGFFMEGIGLSYVIKEMEREYGRFQVKTDQALPGVFPGPVMQYNETDWGFLKRLASLYKWAVLADGGTGWPSIVLGKPDTPVVPVEGLEGGNGTIERRGIGWKDGSPIERLTIQSMEYYHPESRLQIPGLPIMAIYKMRTYLKQEVLYHEYVLEPEGSVGTQPMGNKNIVGKRLGGVVRGHKGESVSVLLDIDKGDVAIGQVKDFFFPFNLEVSGMRDLPEIGGRIHLYFPSIWEWEGEVVSAERTICTFRPGQKVFRHIEGAGIELDEEHIQLHGGGEKEVYVQLGEDGDIYIQGENIMLGTDGGILPYGGSSCRDLRLNAKRAILVRRIDGQKEGAQCGHFIGLKGIVQIKAPGEVRHETDSKGRTSMETMGKEGGDENGVLKVSVVKEKNISAVRMSSITALSTNNKGKVTRRAHNRTMEEIKEKINKDQTKEKIVSILEKFLVLMGWKVYKVNKRYTSMADMAMDLYFNGKNHGIFDSPLEFYLLMANAGGEAKYSPDLLETKTSAPYRGAGYLQITGANKGTAPGKYREFYDHVFTGGKFDPKFNAEIVAEQFPWESACWAWTDSCEVQGYLRESIHPFKKDWRTTWPTDMKIIRVVLLINEKLAPEGICYTYYKEAEGDIFKLVEGQHSLLKDKSSIEEIRKINTKKLGVTRIEVNQMFYRVVVMINGHKPNGMPNGFVKRYLEYLKLTQYNIKFKDNKGNECLQIMKFNGEIVE